MAVAMARCPFRACQRSCPSLPDGNRASLSRACQPWLFLAFVFVGLLVLEAGAFERNRSEVINRRRGVVGAALRVQGGRAHASRAAGDVVGQVHVMVSLVMNWVFSC